MEQTAGKPAIEAIAENVLNTRFEDLDQAAVDNAKNRILDIIGDTIGGAIAPGNDALVNLFQRWGGAAEATVLAYGIQMPTPNAAMANCILCRSFDRGPLTFFMDGKRYPSHSTETTVMTALTYGEYKGISGKELITALMVGDDLAARLSAGIEHAWNRNIADRKGIAEQRGGFEPWGTVTCFGAAAIVGRMMGLNPVQIRNAFGIVINLVSGAGGGLNEGASTFKLSQGDSARNGILAAELAKGGWTGISDAILGRGGYFSTFTPGCDHPEVLTRDLGQKYYSEVVFKPFPGGRPTHVPILAALELARKHKFRAEEIEAVTLRLSPPANYGHYTRPYKIGAYPTGDALFSYKFSTATALVKQKVGNANYMEENIRDPRVQEIIGKIQFADLDRPEGIELELEMKDGRLLTQYMASTTAKGEPPNPFTRDELIAKFMEQVEFSQMVSRSNADRLIQMVENLEKVEDVREIVKLAVKS